MPRRFNVVIPRSDGGLQVYRLKEWLRGQPELVAKGLDPDNSTSHQLRDGLRKLGWNVDERVDEVRLSPPGTVLPANVSAILGDDDDETRTQNDAELSFELEHQLRDFIAANLPRIDIPGVRLTLYRDPQGRNGVEYPTGVGPIDILATDKDGALYVFELKRARSPDHAIGQLTRYMGWLKHDSPGKNVHGFIVAKQIDEKLRYAASVIPDVGLLEYRIEFRVQAAAPLA